MGEDLYSLRVVDRFFSVVLDASQVMYGDRAAEQGFGEEVGGGDCVLQGDVDTNAADGGHGMGRVADAEQAGRTPFLKMVDLDGQELDLVPGVDLGSAS